VNSTDDADFWGEVGLGVWNPKSIKSTQLRDPLHRHLHRCIAHSISGRHDTDNVGRTDFFFLYCLVTGARCNLAYCLADFFRKAISARPTSFLVGGSFIWTIARYFGVKKRGCTEAPVVQPVDMTVCRRMGFVTDVPLFCFIDRWNRILSPYRPGLDPNLEDFAAQQHQHFQMPHVQQHAPSNSTRTTRCRMLPWETYSLSSIPPPLPHTSQIHHLEVLI
jgi:hypothetical protein